jgi:hypothetical protein
VTRRIGPVLLVVAGTAGLLSRSGGVDVFPAPVLGALLALVVAVDASRRRPVGSVIAALLIAVLLAGSLGIGAVGVPPQLTAAALLVAGIALLVSDEDPDGARSGGGSPHSPRAGSSYPGRRGGSRSRPCSPGPSSS